MSTESFYLTTGISYPNGKPHMGHALELVITDFLARYYRQQGRDVFFQTGVDEHGLKIARTAGLEGLEPQAFVDRQHTYFTDLVTQLQASPDAFIRTTSPQHHRLAQALWQACAADITKKTYRAWYNVKQEEFLGSVEEYPDPAVFGVEERFIELIEEENYFFALSRYQEQIIQLLEEGMYRVVPENRSREVVNFIQQKGLLDVSISRSKEKLAWGIPVPGDDEQVMYVWFDALANYLTNVCEVREGKIVPGPYWPANLHVVGKDISRFHAVMWPAMLLSAGIAVPRELLVHGFVLSEGRTMSKSIGNVVDPVEMVTTYGADAVRWFLLKELPTTDDGDFTEARLRQVYDSDLANDFGNLVSRVLKMVNTYGESQVPEVATGQKEYVPVAATWQAYHAAVAARRIDQALAAVQHLVSATNHLIEERKPWVVAKDPTKREELNELLYALAETLRHLSNMMDPAMPGVTGRLATLFAEPLSRAEEYGALPSGAALTGGPAILFPRLT